MRLFKQGDYPKVFMGDSGVSLARAGCLTCDITVGNNAITGQDLNPEQICKKLKYLKNGFLDWGSLKNIGLKLVNRSNVRNDSICMAALKSKDQFCVLEINHGAHFVLLWSRDIFGLKVYDPLYGNVNRKYNNTITGFRIISKL